MKVPLRYQITEYDCGTVSLLNAFSYLFDREEIPAEIVKTISCYTLDCHDEDNNLGHGGTSREAVSKLSDWINKFAEEKKFDIKCVKLESDKVTIDAIRNCINNNGVAFVRCWQMCQHYVIITNIDDLNTFIFDPYYLDVNYYENDDEVNIILDYPFKYNRVVKNDRLFSLTNKDFSLGENNIRECLLINRKN